MVEGGGFEPPKLSRQIYSLIPLTAREPLQFCGAKFCQPQAALSTPNPLLDINIFDTPTRQFEQSALAKSHLPTPPNDVDENLSIVRNSLLEQGHLSLMVTSNGYIL